MAKKRPRLADLRSRYQALTEQEARKLRGGFRTIPGASGSNGAFPWLEIDIRRPNYEQQELNPLKAGPQRPG